MCPAGCRGKAIGRALLIPHRKICKRKGRLFFGKPKSRRPFLLGRFSLFSRSPNEKTFLNRGKRGWQAEKNGKTETVPVFNEKGEQKQQQAGDPVQCCVHHHQFLPAHITEQKIEDPDHGNSRYPYPKCSGKTQARPYFIQASHKKNQIGKAVTT